MAENLLNLVDSSGWIEYIAEGPNAGIYAEPLSDTNRLIVPTICVYEVFRVVLRRRGEDNALRAAALMNQGREVPLTSALALEAARLAHELGLAMSDGIILATARLTGATLWTQDVDFAGIPRVRYFPKMPA
ncbi:MAG: type II toxin-antitoxin system VapC family toxin [Gammaproteobacteria bacterium]|nr:type II toxin-antitoxin system VapC family toxin [Gammaproteobacteria bacterium]MCY3817043.1 type II toxin-antitoxin system VapC family toxin [Gammaproteobacteria bacterium]